MILNYYEVASQAEENLITEIGAIIVRTDLLPPPPTPIGEPVIAYSLTNETDFSGGYLSAPDSDNLDFGTGNFEINIDFKMSVIANGMHQFLMSKGTTLNNAWYIMFESINPNAGVIYLTTSNNNAVIAFQSGIVDTTTWHNLKVKRVDGVTTVYLDGIAKGSTTLPLADTTGALYVGAWNYTPNSHRFLGKMKNVSIIKG